MSGERASKRTKRNEGTNEISYVEFYSGVGGWTMALKRALEKLSSEKGNGEEHLQPCRIAALDHSDLCTRVFEHNFGTDRKSFQIERLKLKQVEEWNARIWFLSPPCQPHTRQHSNQQNDLSDSRSSSFLHLCDLLSKMENLPSLLVCENVIGFEKSNSFQRWQTVLAERGYFVGHFHLSPTQINMPNDRPRYYCVAIKKEDLSDSSDTLSLRHYLKHETVENNSDSLRISLAIPELGVNEQSNSGISSDVLAISYFLDSKSDNSLKLPEKVLKSNASWCFDVVTPNDRRSSCFTHSYGRYIRGTGSILYDDDSFHVKLLKPEEREFQEDWTKDFDLSKLRYFSGSELSRLFGFSNNFSFPSNCSMKQQWKLVGNSINVHLASCLVELGLRSMQK